MQRQLATRKRTTEVGRQNAFALHGQLNRHLKSPHRIASRMFGLVHGQVGAFEHLCHRFGMRTEQGHPYTARAMVGEVLDRTGVVSHPQ